MWVDSNFWHKSPIFHTCNSHILICRNMWELHVWRSCVHNRWEEHIGILLYINYLVVKHTGHIDKDGHTVFHAHIKQESCGIRKEWLVGHSSWHVIERRQKPCISERERILGQSTCVREGLSVTTRVAPYPKFNMLACHSLTHKLNRKMSLPFYRESRICPLLLETLALPRRPTNPREKSL